MQTGSGNSAVGVGYFFRILFHLEVLLDLGNIAWFGVVDLTKFSIVVDLTKLAGCEPEFEIAPSMSVIFLSNFVPPRIPFRSRKYGLFGVVDSTKFSIVAYGGN